MTVSYDGMFLGIALEIKLLLLSLLTGAVLGSVYDLLRAARLSVKHCAAAVFAEDFLFTLFFELAYYIFCVELLEGKLRLFVLAGFAAGFIFYLCTLGRLVCGTLSSALGVLIKICAFLVRYVKKTARCLCGMTFFQRLNKKSSKTSCHN